RRREQAFDHLAAASLRRLPPAAPRPGGTGRTLLALRRPGLDHPVDGRLPDLTRRRSATSPTGPLASEEGLASWTRPEPHPQSPPRNRSISPKSRSTSASSSLCSC